MQNCAVDNLLCRRPQGQGQVNGEALARKLQGGHATKPAGTPVSGADRWTVSNAQLCSVSLVCGYFILAGCS